jgi:hypothetical protein
MSSAYLPGSDRAPPSPGRERRRRARALLALLRANALYWPQVAPLARRQLRRWERRARQIPDAEVRALALAKLRAERMNPLLAATLATLSPPGSRSEVVQTIVALQVAYDHLDALAERKLTADGGYLESLVRTALAGFWRLPAAAVVVPTAITAAERCRLAQALAHEAIGGEERRLESWAHARAGANGEDLDWPELLAGAQASVLCLHALVAAAADPATTQAQAEALDALYLRIGALTMLDSLVDREEDLQLGERGYLRRYRDAAHMGERLAGVARETARRTHHVPHGAHHLMTTAGVLAYYGSASSASDPLVAPAFAAVRRQLGVAWTAPALALLRTWRRAHRVTLWFRPVRLRTSGWRRSQGVRV